MRITDNLRYIWINSDLSNMTVTLKSIKTGETAQIIAIGEGTPAYRAKLLALGLLPGAQFNVVRKAPLGDPIEIQICGYRLSLRKREAALLHVEKVG